MKRDLHQFDSDTLELLTIFADNAEIGLYIADYYTCEILFANKKMLNYSSMKDLSTVKGKKCWTSLDPNRKERCSFCPYSRLIDSDGNPLEPYLWEMNLKPYNAWIKVINQAVRWSDGRLAHMVTFYDITETRNMQKKLSDLAFKDRLLGLKNDISLERDIRETEKKPSLLIFDILSLQKINEAYGREIGNYLLMSVRDWFINQKIPNSELYRIGGDEFCLTVANARPDTVKKIANNFSRRLREPWIYKHDGSRLRVFCTAAIGVVLGEYIKNDDSLLNLIERTLETAKDKKAVTVYDKKMDLDYNDRLQLELSLKRCVRDGMDGFDVYYQPITDSVSGIWCGFEALCRWNSPELGYISPLLLIPEAERLELIGAIGLWVLETSVSKCKAWGLDKHTDFILDVNISAVQFLDVTLAKKIIKVLRKHNYPGEKLCLEITESTQFTFTDQSLKTIEHLRKYNILVALDDFGTGYSSFNNLKNLPVDIVKIERDFVTNIETDEYHQYLFCAIAELVHTVNMRLIAEGVERKSQMDILAKKGADCLQGYLFSEPLPPGKLEDQLYHFYRTECVQT